jgi:hypothetical protein
MLDVEIDEINCVPCVNGHKLALIEADEDAFIPRLLERWADRPFKFEELEWHPPSFWS